MSASNSSGWMPIETAPSDQTAILGCHINSKIMHVTWRFAVGDDLYVRFGEIEGRGWRPTHWQPLPKPPVRP